MTCLQLANVLCIHVFSLIILTLIATNLQKCVDTDPDLLRQMFLLVFFTMGGILCDSASWVLNGRTGVAALYLNLIFTSFDYLLAVVPAIAWYVISIYMTRGTLACSLLRRVLFYTFFGAIALLVSLNPYTGFLFSIDSRNNYRRGPGFYLLFSVALVMLLLATRQVFLHRYDHSLDLLWPQFFWVPPITCVIVQALLPGTNLLYMGTTVSILMLFIGLQTKSNRLDYLTGVHNRRYLDGFLDEKVRQGSFAAILIDVDHYKIINDNYGHLIGDEILIAIASVLKVSTRKRDCVARYGGDEFLVAVDSGDIDVLYTVISRINYQIFQFNNTSEYTFNISVSMGYDIFDPLLYKTSRDFIKHIDQLLYKGKQKKPTRLELKRPLSDE